MQKPLAPAVPVKSVPLAPPPLCYRMGESFIQQHNYQTQSLWNTGESAWQRQLGTARLIL